MSKILTRVLLWLVALVALLAGLVYALTYHPRDQEDVPVACNPEAPTLKAGQPFRVLNWNIQYLAGKGYVFFYDLLDGSGPDTRPSKEAMASTLEEVVRVIKTENPDVVLLQEVDTGAKRTDFQDQEKILAERLGYACSASAYYWKARFVPHPQIMGAVGMKVVTYSRFKIDQAIRHQLPLIPADPVTQAFNFRRAILDVVLPVEGGESLHIMNTHLDAFAQGTDAMEKQVKKTHQVLRNAGKTVLIGGDFNLLPDQAARARLHEQHQAYYNPESELGIILQDYQSMPSLQEVQQDPEKWFTHYPNDPLAKGPDRTIDYFFYDTGVKLLGHHVRREDTLKISDHLPMVAEFQVQ
ncbi:endonuclease/exonuclease/phosphatase family protein [Deinococcus cellulosilyticus]|uniref:Metal-dependent hydrolase n=1 Tax=Deinococcus cellulosilyticus (strain DSM 18568 / NBRC 106333 / KACC 11606 / 5516J-15) TaxID=1223518 RepID=A0A511N0N8_DEIC1|nr:endonuclease/exonuclease/phosphatase family protein [Deinococcus cellulosilyticus]GEM46423.1 metal-dependent hydrolase [Deinococcus cellulosilyticus NBRC 106333 = KACC 11606]